MPSKSRASGPAPRRKELALAALAGGALPLAFAPFHFWWLAPCCYAGLFALWRGATPREALQRGFIFGAAEFLLGIYWIWNSVHEIGEAPIPLALLLMFGLVAAMAVYPALVGYVAARWLGTSGLVVWLGTLPALFVLFEWLRGWFLTGFGWLSPGYSQTESWLIGFAPVLGVLGVGWAVLLVAGALAGAAFGGMRGRVVGLVAIVVVFSKGYFLARLEWTTPKAEEITVALAQGAVKQTLKWDPAELPGIMALYRGLTVDALGADLIVWPEAAIPDYYEFQGRFLDEIGRLTSAAGSEIMLGLLRWQDGGAQNALYTLGQEETPYIKRHLVPYGEYFPVPGFVRDWMRALDLPTVDTRPGDPGQPPVALLGERIAVTICYEDVFGAEQLHSFPEATLLVNISNDAWFGDSIAPHQHLQIARMRAAEVRRWQLRATNTGITAVIDPHGRVVARLDQFEPGVLRASVRGVEGATPYTIWGDWLAVGICLTVGLGALVLGRRSRDDSAESRYSTAIVGLQAAGERAAIARAVRGGS
jgi:apolipoprotein N-acyltransferase